MATGNTIALCIQDIENKRNTLHTKVTTGFGLTADQTLESVTNVINGISVSDLGTVNVSESDEKGYGAGYYKAFTIKGSSAEGNYILQNKEYTLTYDDLKTGVLIDNDEFNEEGQKIYGLNFVDIKPIDSKYFNFESTDVSSEDVLSGVTFVDQTGAKVEGTMPNNGSIGDIVLDVDNTSVTIDAGYTTGGTVSIDLEDPRTVTPSTTRQEINPTDGKLLSQVIVSAIPVATPVTTSIDGINTTEATIPAGHYTSASKVSFDDSVILSRLQAI